jgi:hypothetical protein
MTLTIFLLALVSADTLGFESRGTHDHILQTQIRDLPNLEDHDPVFISLERGWHNYTPRHWAPFSSLLTNRLVSSLYGLRTDGMENTASSRISIFTCLSVSEKLLACFITQDRITVKLSHDVTIRIPIFTGFCVCFRNCVNEHVVIVGAK